MKYPNTLKFTLFAIMTGILVSCGGSNESTPAASSSIVETTNASKATPAVLKMGQKSPFGADGEDKGYALSTVIWPSDKISVCWEMSDIDFSNTAENRELVKSSITKSWEAASDVRFQGWQKCTLAPTDIRIAVEDQGPRTLGLGTQLKNISKGMLLNFTYNNWSEVCKTMLNYCTSTIAVHEFGHALGFAHEQNRSDRPSSCKEPSQGTSGDVFVGSWDISSVMNYCNPDYNGNGILSQTDKVMVQKYYNKILLPNGVISTFLLLMKE